MSMPSPFEIGARVGKGTANAFSEYQDTNSIDHILKQASQSEDPNAVDDIMGQLIQRVAPERQQAAAQLLQNKKAQLQGLQKQQQQQQSYQSLGLNPALAGIDASIAKEFIKNQQNQTSKNKEKAQLLGDTFSRAEEILKGGNTGIFTGGKLTPQGRKDRAELDTLSEVFISQLIPLLNPKGTISKERFNYIKSLAPNSSDTDATIEGKLAALRKIFAGDLSSIDVASQGNSSLNASNSNFVQIKSPDGKIRNIPSNMVESAEKAGGTIVQ